MPLDPSRLEPLVRQLAAAELSYNAALRQLADAKRQLVAAAENAAAQARLRAAQRTVAQTRIQVTEARRALDTRRLEELQPISTSQQLLGSIPGTQVLGLFPVALEAKLDPGRLRIRVWPDAISTSTHDPRLAPHEREAAMQYWRGEAESTSEETSRFAWRALAEALGVTRAAWAAQVLTPTNRDSLRPGVAPLFPEVALEDDEAPFVPRPSLLPDRWIAVGINDRGEKVFEQLGASIPHDLAVGLDTTPSETAALSNEEGKPIQLPPRMRWLTDFSVAVQVGMAFDIQLPPEIARFEELYVFGARLTETPAQSAESLGKLLTGHRLSRGLAFVAQNTPTNNSANGGSGFPSRSQRIDEAYVLERRPRTFPPNLSSNGATTARAFGLPSSVFATLSTSGATGAIGAEPNGFEPEAAQAMQTALWQVTVGPFLEDFLHLGSDRVESLRQHFLKHVRASGPVPVMRVGRQPYGILPVTALSDFVPAPAEGIDPKLLRLLGAIRSWFGLRRTPPIFSGSTEEALRQLGRSSLLYAETTSQNSNPANQNRAATLARVLQIATRRQIDDTWRSSTIRGVVDAVPQAVERPIVDAATKDELLALASASPKAILARPLPTSVLARLARQAALLEWARFAQGVIVPLVDVPSRRMLLSRAGTKGSAAYIEALVQAFAQTPPVTGPIGPITTIGSVHPQTKAAPRLPPVDHDPDPDPDPEPEPEPDPEPEPGEPEINPTEAGQIRNVVGDLSHPRSTAPGASRLAAFRAAVARLAEFPNDRLEYELFGVLDISNHRADAWYTSLAAARLASLRQASPEGIVIGGWGCLHDVQRTNVADPRQRAEFIHAPSLDQAAASAVLRAGAVRAQGGGSGHADIDLSSRRVRLARWLLEGVRQGRPVSELLGARFERALKGTPGEVHLAALRAQFKSFSSVGVLDGLALQQTGAPADMDHSVTHAAEGLSEALDAVADALTAEAVYQIVKGNPEGAVTTLDKIAKGEQPPALTVTETPAAGIRLTHRIAVALPAMFSAPGWLGRRTVRSKAEPLIDAWCGVMLGPPDLTILTVVGANTQAKVPLSALPLAAIDIALACRENAGELAEWVLLAASEIQPGLANARVSEDVVWKDLTGIGRALANVFTRAEPLKADSFDVPSALATAPDENMGDLPSRVAEASSALADLRSALAARTNEREAVRRAAAFGIRIPDRSFRSPPTSEQLDALLPVVDARLSAATRGSPRDRLAALFGGDLPGVVAFKPRDPAALQTATDPAPAGLFGRDPHAPRLWLDAVGRVHEKSRALAEVLLRQELRGREVRTPLVAQVPWVAGDAWIATSFSQTRTPAGRLSVLIHAPDALPASENLGGLLIDTWTEVVPASQHDTAMALRFNNASTRPPQAILLGVSPDPSKAWTTDTVIEILRQTLMLTRLRMQTSTMLSEGGHMPLALLGQRPGNVGISFSL